MPDNPQDILSKTLLRLENELSSFGAVQNALKEAKEKLTKAEKEWDKLTKEQQQSAIELVKATRSAIETTNAVTSQSKEMTDSLIPLAKAIETVNFPLRLDKIDMGVATQASTLASFQETVGRGLRTLHEGNEKNDKNISEGFDVMKTSFLAGSKKDTIILSLLAVNSLILIVIVVMLFLKGNVPHG